MGVFVGAGGWGRQIAESAYLDLAPCCRCTQDPDPGPWLQLATYTQAGGGGGGRPLLMHGRTSDRSSSILLGCTTQTQTAVAGDW